MPERPDQLCAGSESVELKRLREAVAALEARGKTYPPLHMAVRIDELESALHAIVGPQDEGPWIAAYRDAGGGYEGLQAIARAALEGP